MDAPTQGAAGLDIFERPRPPESEVFYFIVITTASLRNRARDTVIVICNLKAARNPCRLGSDA